MTDTLAYYNNNALQFFAATVQAEMKPLHDRFLGQVTAGGHILDAGCGSGRDSKAFLNRGYQITAFDASPELAQLASAHLGQAVAVQTFAELSDKSCYDGIWACASLLHLPQVDLPGAINRLWEALKPCGAFYLCFKLGEGERQLDGRHFTDTNAPQLRSWLNALPDLANVDIWDSEDRRSERPVQWINAIAKRHPAPTGKLVTGGNNPFLPHLCSAIARSSEIDLAVAFIKTTGLHLLLPDLRSAVVPDEQSTRRAARLRVVTSDYLGVTDPEALRRLLLLQEQGAQVRIYESAGHSFHMKAYLFASGEHNGRQQGTAFIGSSNISKSALQDGLEWNYRIDYPGDDGFFDARRGFEEVFFHPRTRQLSDAWIDRYEARRVTLQFAVAPGSEERDEVPEPTLIQKQALVALQATRHEGFSRGLVVLATGLGKTWLSAFDAQQIGAQRILFVAHREEILSQAADTFLRIRPQARVGYYMGKQRDVDVDVLCASVQTLSRNSHLERFTPQHFDYIVIDEFHHADAPTYRRLLKHFSPRFLLGLTATPDRTDQSDILSLCDDNLVFTCQLFAGIEANLLAPFHYFGIFDDAVDYREIPWRNGRFDPEQLSNKLATLARAAHALKQWQQRAQVRTLAFCVSIRHAEFMAKHFSKAGIAAAAVYGGSRLSRGDALEQLRSGQLQIIFSVDLFSEGVDLPAIDTVMMLRPTESKILFLQQLGRGLRKAKDKERVVVLDFIGNHHSFFHKFQALLDAGATFKQLAEFARKIETGRLKLPEGCYINYDLQLIEFLKSLDSEGLKKDYEALRQGLGRRPTLSEFYRAGANLSRMRQQYGGWFDFVKTMGDLNTDQTTMAIAQQGFLRELETTAMTKSYKMVLVEALQELDGWQKSPSLEALAERSWQVLQRRRPLLADLPDELRALTDGSTRSWQDYWRINPVNAWIGGRGSAKQSCFFTLVDGCFTPTFALPADRNEGFETLVQEVVDYRLAAYEVRRTAASVGDNVIPFRTPAAKRTALPYFPNLKIACGHFKSGTADAEEFRSLGLAYGHLDPARHFIARASGNSMDGGKLPIRDDDYLLLERLQAGGSITGSVMAIERQDEAGDNQYLLRSVIKRSDGHYVLKANNPDYADLFASDEMHTLARLKGVIDPLEMAIGQSLLREEIPELFGAKFNPGNWNSGHVVLNEEKAHILLVTLNKQGKAQDHRYIDHWVDETTFHWQSQNATTPGSKRGQEIVEHRQRGISIHLFVREAKLADGKAAPFVYYGAVRYRSHTGSEPMSVLFEIES